MRGVTLEREREKEKKNVMGGLKKIKRMSNGSLAKYIQMYEAKRTLMTATVDLTKKNTR